MWRAAVTTGVDSGGVSFGSIQSDAELVARASGGDDRAFAELVKRHERRVYNLAFRMLGREEDARDATQDTFLSCYRRLSSFRGEAAFTTWLHRIAVNASYDMLRRRKGTTLGQDDLPEPPPSPDHGDRAAAAVDVQRALMQVVVEYRAVLVLCDLQGHAYDEVAEMLSIPLGTVKSRLHRGRIALGRVLGVDASVHEPPGPPGEREPTGAEPPSKTESS
jgi:RNA polymerase sigma-70 factor, ECF subfamily